MSSGDYPMQNQTGFKKDADQKFCYSCGVVMHFSAASCPKCGASQSAPASLPMAIAPAPAAPASHAVAEAAQLPAHHVYCRGCGKAIHESAASCPKCGAPQSAVASGVQSGGKDRVTAAMLAMLLGSFGVHRFYLGHIGLGFLYLIFFWAWIPGIIGFIEGIVYLTKSDQEFKAQYR